MDDHHTNLMSLLQLRSVIGPVYGSEDLALLLYSLVRRECPSVVVEFGTGLGVTAFWIAQALKENGLGHLWTIDDGRHFASRANTAGHLKQITGLPPFLSLGSPPDLATYFRKMASLLTLEECVTLISTRLDVAGARLLPDYPLPFIPGQQIDMLFSDFEHRPPALLRLLAACLPHMSDSSSIFIDSASTYLPSFWVLETIVEQMNRGKVPRRLIQNADPQFRAQLTELVMQRRFTLVHLTEKRNRRQNSTAWIKIEPVDLTPYPETWLRGAEGLAQEIEP